MKTRYAEKDKEVKLETGCKIIQTYLEEEGESCNSLATRAGVCPVTLWKFLKGKQKSLSPADAVKIQKATGNKINAAKVGFGGDVEVFVT